MPPAEEAAPASAAPHASPEKPAGVTPIELFFDLVFVFVLTQATHQVESHPGWSGLFQGLLPLAALWWMFGAFSWLTNAVRPEAVRLRLLLVLTMAAFFVMGLDLPYAFDPDGWAFGLAFLVAVGMHVALFLTATEASARAGIVRLAPFNAFGGVLILTAPHLPDAGTWACWVAAVLVLYLAMVIGRIRGFVVEPHHFVERHGLIILIVLGESVVAVGIGAGGRPVDWQLAGGILLGIAVAAGIWWTYFAGDDERAVRALSDAPVERRQTLGYVAFGLAHAVMIAGIVLVAAGISDGIHHLGTDTDRWWLGSGVAVFLLGHAWHRHVLKTGPIAARMIAAVVVVPLAAVAAFAGWAALTGAVVVLVAMTLADHFGPQGESAAARVGRAEQRG
ncbi:low temperature requirement protein A [Streptomyces sp. SID3343]|uniref:low temperature requirement protein A n=1 Tax=Streptomyces sp. SID3343 TaxID=2690260 RepID=UPI00137178A2|nr:low temperature requirement protein A [Streptomyces sp. SID3343]